LGYKQIELASYDSGRYYGFEPAAFKKIADSLGLKAVSAHIPLNHMKENPELVVSSAKALGLSFVVLPWLSPEDRASIESYKSHIEVMKNIAPMCTAAGMTFAYHNHDFEFDTLAGQVPMDLILSETDPAHVKLELDLYWVSKVGIDPVQLLQKVGHRVVLWHVKDMDSTPEKKFTEVGNGTINYTEIFKLRGTTAFKYYFVEQDKSDDPFKSIATSFNYVSTNLEK
jgi:sugar phosphate isomerase/epimerase